MLFAFVLMVGSLGFLILHADPQHPVQPTPGRSIWRDFGLGLGLMVLFFATWIAHVIAQYQVYTDETFAHGEQTSIGGLPR